jgi:hypothetical protein
MQPVPGDLQSVVRRTTAEARPTRMRASQHLTPRTPMSRFASFSAALTAAFILSACVFAPPVHTSTSTTDVAKMGEQAIATCGAGNVKEVNAKSFTCK